MTRLDGKVALITGGAWGMGAAHAQLFVEQGASVVITDVLTDEGDAVAASLGDRAVFAHHDVTDVSRWAEVVAQAEEAFGPVNVLINNAGVVDEAPFDGITPEQFRRVIDINLPGVFLGMQAVIPSMRRAGGGSIVNISSIGGFVAGPQFAYIASKWGLRGLTKSAALEFASDNIRANSVHPGYITTPMTAAVSDDETMKQGIIDKIPMRRFAEPAEVSKLVLYLASDDSSYSTGSEFIIDGGILSGA